MSDAALRYVRACAHPAVKDATRDLFEAIASFVPEGETTTTFIGMPALASRSRRHRRTVIRRLADLVAMGEVIVLDGGAGKVARYQIVRLAGAPPIVAAPLPLRADLRPVERRARPRPTLPDDTTGDLFADPSPAHDQTANNRWRSITGWAVQPVAICHRLAANLWRSITGWRSESEQPVTIDHRLTIEPVAIDHRLAAIWRSEGEQPVTIDHRLTPLSSSRDLVGGDARAREPADAFLEWFEATYPTVHHGAVCTVRRTRDRPLVRELLQRPLTDVAHLQAMTALFWSISTDGVVNSDRWWIAEKVTVRGIVVLHRKADFLDQEVRRAASGLTVAVAPTRGRGVSIDRDDAWAYDTPFHEAMDLHVNRHDLVTWIQPLAVVLEPDRVVLCAPSEPFAAYVRKHYGAACDAAAQQVHQRPVMIVAGTPAQVLGRKIG